MYLFQLAAASCTAEGRRNINQYINRRLRPTRRLPFKVWMAEDSRPNKIIFRVEHTEAGTANRVFVVIDPLARRPWRRIRIDASNGSNWHHLRSHFVEWLRNVLWHIVD